MGVKILEDKRKVEEEAASKTGSQEEESPKTVKMDGEGKMDGETASKKELREEVLVKREGVA